MLHANQFAFRENHSAEQLLQKIIEKAKYLHYSLRYTAIISFDIKSAFDSIDWHVILTQLIKMKVPKNIFLILNNYLSDRQVSYRESSSLVSSFIFGGCPQGSCLGPILWNIVANAILCSMSSGDSQVFAYADDFTMIVGGGGLREGILN